MLRTHDGSTSFRSSQNGSDQIMAARGHRAKATAGGDRGCPGDGRDTSVPGNQSRHEAGYPAVRVAGVRAHSPCSFTVCPQRCVDGIAVVKRAGGVEPEAGSKKQEVARNHLSLSSYNQYMIRAML